MTGADPGAGGQETWEETFPAYRADVRRFGAMEDPVRVVLLMTVLMASGCVVRAGHPHRRWFWHRRVEITNPVNSTASQALTLPPKTDTSEQ